MHDEILTEVRGSTLVITLNRPDQGNALNSSVSEGLVESLDYLDNSDELSVGVIRGAGKIFCTGIDLKAFATEGVPQGLGNVLQNGTRKPTIAAVEGYALAGGLELALTCDLIVASHDCELGIPEVKVGLFAAGGGLLRLPHRLPYGIAMEMALTGDSITGEQSYSYGLVNRSVKPGEVLDCALEIARNISRNAPLSVAASKEVLAANQGRTETDLWEFQKPFIPKLFKSNDAKEGPRAFAEKREPKWSGT